jgi:stage IV sporulation protein FB
LLCEPARSPYDWQFFFLGFHVRVSWLFWLISAVWGYDAARGWDEVYHRQMLETPGMFALLLIWIGVCFVSILIHELGHALTKRWYGISSYIVLYHFGGLSINDGADAWRRPARLRQLDEVVIAAAGPVFQIAFGLLVAAIATAFGLMLGTTGLFLSGWLPIPEGELPSNAALMVLIDASVFTSIFWALLNLLPVLPLDGGRIAQGLIGQYQRNSGFQEATILSIVVSALVALYGFRNDQPTLGIFFAIFAILNFQSLQGNVPMR